MYSRNVAYRFLKDYKLLKQRNKKYTMNAAILLPLFCACVCVCVCVCVCIYIFEYVYFILVTILGTEDVTNNKEYKVPSLMGLTF
jgi:hypothetical protein